MRAHCYVYFTFFHHHSSGSRDETTTFVDVAQWRRFAFSTSHGELQDGGDGYETTRTSASLLTEVNSSDTIDSCVTFWNLFMVEGETTMQHGRKAVLTTMARDRTLRKLTRTTVR
jgi:hypothetical protein